jgi:hypothetical protein
LNDSGADDFFGSSGNHYGGHNAGAIDLFNSSGNSSGWHAPGADDLAAMVNAAGAGASGGGGASGGAGMGEPAIALTSLDELTPGPDAGVADVANINPIIGDGALADGLYFDPSSPSQTGSPFEFDTGSLSPPQRSAYNAESSIPVSGLAGGPFADSNTDVPSSSAQWDSSSASFTSVNPEMTSIVIWSVLGFVSCVGRRAR